MKLLLDIPEDKLSFMIALLRNLPFVKTETISTEKDLIVPDLKEAVSELNTIRKGIGKSVPLKDFLNEL